MRKDAAVAIGCVSIDSSCRKPVGCGVTRRGDPDGETWSLLPGVGTLRCRCLGGGLPLQMDERWITLPWNALTRTQQGVQVNRRSSTA